MQPQPLLYRGSRVTLLTCPVGLRGAPAALPMAGLMLVALPHGLPVLVWFLGHGAALAWLPPLPAGLWLGAGAALRPGVFFLHRFLETQVDGDRCLGEAGGTHPLLWASGALQPPAAFRSTHRARAQHRSRSRLPKWLQASCKNGEKTKRSIFVGSKCRLERGMPCAANRPFGKAGRVATSAAPASAARTRGLRFPNVGVG